MRLAALQAPLREWTLGGPRPLLSAREESVAERAGGHAVSEAHEPHLHDAIAWIECAQDAAGGAGIARGYSLIWSPYFRLQGWQPAYPETTGYTIPTLYLAADALQRPRLAERATRAAHWECELQMPDGAVRSGVVGQDGPAAVFNTGQVIFGWLAAYERTADDRFATAARRASTWLVRQLGADGIWWRGQSPFARGGACLYNARTAWALAEAGSRLGEPTFLDAAHRHLHAVVARQHPDGWLPDCCLNDASRPLLHTLAYALRGLAEGARIFDDHTLRRGAKRGAAAVANALSTNDALPGRFASGWRRTSRWSCLTGEAQMANLWLRLHEMTGDVTWLAPVERVLRHLKRTQNRTSPELGLRGGIRGSSPIDGEYAPFEVLSWATKFFADALMRHARVRTNTTLRSTDPIAPLA